MTEEAMSDARLPCPGCGQPIPDGSPHGLCPKCALSGAAYPSDPAADTVPRGDFVLPSLAEVAAAFPQLEIIELIGQGGMGAVFKARQIKLDRLVALKILACDDPENSSDFAERFQREGRVLAKLNHPNIVGVHDFGESAGIHYLMMEYVDGVNLRQAMHAGRFSPEQALAIVPRICDALQYAHNSGVLHRDIKPENILLDSHGEVKIVDFGIAKLLGAGGGTEPTLTKTRIPGTPHYMAPEQIEKPADVDHRADIYSMGVVVYELLTGELPLGRFAPPSEKSKVDARIDEIVLRTLEKERSLRQQSATEVRTQVEGVKPLGPQSGTNPQPVSEKAIAPAPESRNRELVKISHRSILLMCFAFAILGFNFFPTFNVNMQRMKASEQRMQIDALEEVVENLETQLREYQVNGMDPVTHRTELASRIAELGRLKSQQRIVRGGDLRLWTIAGWSTLILAAGLLVWATVTGWGALISLRDYGIRTGRVPAAISALILPIVLINACVFLILVAPMTPHWRGPAISLAGILCIAVDFWIIRSVHRWLASGPTAATLDPADGSGRTSIWWFLLVGLVVGEITAAGYMLASGNSSIEHTLVIVGVPVAVAGLAFLAIRSTIWFAAVLLAAATPVILLNLDREVKSNPPKSFHSESQNSKSRQPEHPYVGLLETVPDPDKPDSKILNASVLGGFEMRISIILEVNGERSELENFQCVLGGEGNISTVLEWGPGKDPGSLQFTGRTHMEEGSRIREYWSPEIAEIKWQPVSFEDPCKLTIGDGSKEIILLNGKDPNSNIPPYVSAILTVYPKTNDG